MTNPFFSTQNSGLKVLSACLLSSLLVMMPFVQMAAAAKRTEPRGQRQESRRQAAEGRQQDTAKNAAPENVSLNAPVPKAAPAPLAGPVIVATKDDGLPTLTTVAPGGTINYSVNIKNNGTTSPADDATGVTFTDIIDAHTTLVVDSAVAAVSDRYNAIGNVQLVIPDGSTDLLGNDIDPDTGSNVGMTVTAETKSSTACTGGCSNNVTISADGSFTYDPPVGFSGTDTFTYTAHSTAGPGTATETVTITVANEIWFIDRNSSCVTNCNGRLSHPFTSLASFSAANLGGAGQPGDNDWIFIYESATPYTGPATLRSGQKFIGQDATASLSSLTLFPPASGTDQLPVMNSGNGIFVNISGTNVNGINLLSGNTLRGFRVTDVGTGTKISGTSFGTLVVGNSGSPDVLLSGTGRALSLTTGTLSNTGGFISVASTSGAQGISLSGVADSDGAGAGSFSFGSTTISNSTSQGILIGTTPADLNFGNTSITASAVGVSFQNNSGGTRTFGTLGISGGANEAFLHGTGGGNVTVTGAATLSSAGSAISVNAPASTTAINFQAATSATTTGAGTTAVLWVGAANTSMTFNSLSITRNNATALDASVAGTINVTNGTGSITNTTPGGPAIVAANIALNANFSSINSTAGNNGVLLTTVTGTSNFGTGQLTGTSGGSTFHITGGTCTVTYGGDIDQNAAAPMVTVAGGHVTGTVTFTGSLDATLGTGLQFSNADGTYNFNGTTALHGGDAGVDILLGSGGTFAFGGTAITNPSGVAFNVDGTTTAVTGGITISGTISKNNDGKLIDFFNYDTGTATISGTISCTSLCDGVEVTNNGGSSGTVNFSGATKTLNTGGSTAVNLDDNDGGNINFTGGGLDIDTTSGVGFNAVNGGTVTVTTGTNPNTIDSTTGTALNVSGTTIGASPLTFRSINVTGNNTLPASGIILNATGSSGLTVTGNGGSCTPATPTCTGGTIQGTGSHGISFTNVSNIEFNLFRVHNTGDHGLFGDGVNNFTLRDSYFHDFGNTAGGAVSEDAMHFESTNLANTAAGHGLTGTVIIQRNTIGPDSAFTRTPNPPLPENKGIVVRNHNDVNLTMTVTGTKFTQISNDGLDVDIRNETSTAGGVGTATLNVDGSTGDGTNTFDNINGRSINFVQPVDNAAARIYELTIKNNTFTSVGIGGRWMASARGTMNARYNNNTMTNTSDDSIRSESDAVNAALSPKATVNATVSGNAMGGGSIFISLHRQAITSMTFINNTNIGGTAAGAGGCGTCLGVHTGINLRSDRGSSLGIDFQGNTGQADGSLAFAQSALDMQATNNGGGNSTICANVGGAGALKNTLSQIPDTAGQQVISIDPVGGSTITIEGGPGGSPGTENFLIANNTLNGTNKVAISTPAAVPSGVGANCVTSMLVQNAPASPSNYLARADQLFQNEIPTSSLFSSLDTKDSVSAALEILNRSTQPTSLSNDGTASILAKAVIDSAFNRALIAPAAFAHSAEVISHRSEVSDQKSEIRTHHAPSSKLETRNTRDEGTGLRAHYAALSKLATRSATAAPAPMAGETVTANIGTLPAGGSVTITFQVTVENPPNLTLLNPPRVENQGTVSGSNFASVLTDDPNVGGGADKTATRIDLFDTTTSLVSDLNPSNDGDTVTFTATINETPVQGSVDPAGTVDFIDTSNGNAVICNDVPVSAGTAQCQTSTLSAGSTHNIRADYSGDGNFDPSQSNIVAQVVNACSINPVVTKIADTNDGTCDADCSLREAIATVCSAPNNIITFDTNGVFATPQTITLSASFGNLTIDRSTTIQGPSHGVTVVGSGNASHRVFVVNASKTATITNMTITGGNSDAIGGGGIKNDGTLTLKNSTVSGNATTQNGAGIHNSSVLNVVNSTISGNTSTIDGGGLVQDGASPSLTMINSTVSGNTANGFGGGLDLRSGTATIINSTITGNHSDNDDDTNGGAGGIRQQSATVTIHNTIVAGNYKGSGTTTANDIEGTVTGSNNLIGEATTAGGLTNGVNGNIVGAVIANVLDTVLANNGGPTNTHALVASGPAVEAGSNANLPTDAFDVDGDLNTAEILPVDQRGVGYPRTADSADADTTQTVDIGAFELHPSVENIADKTTAEDTPFNFNFNLGDDTGTLITGGTVTATSSNQTLVPDANLLITGSGGSRNLAITPAPDANSPADGTATITVTVTATNGRTAVDTFVVTVTEVNDAPVPTNDTIPDIDEDCATGCTSGKYVITFATLLSNDTNKGAANESGQTLNITAVSSPTGGTVAINGTNVEFTPTADFFGPAGFTYTVTDDGTTNALSDPKTGNATVSFNINSINDPPSFSIAGNPPAVNEDAGAQTVSSFATSISAGSGETQTLTFNLTPTGTTGNLTFASGPTINSSTGDLTYTSNADTNGTATFSVTLSDDGSNTPPNSNTSAAQSFTITVNAVDDAPTFQLGANPSVAEDAGAQNIAGFAFNFQPGPVTATDESGQTLVGYVLTPTGTTGGLTFSATPAIDTAGALTFTASADSSGTATFDVVATDTGSNTPPNVNQSAPVSFTITVNAANDPPVNTVPGAQGTPSNTPLTFSSGNGNQISVADADAGANPIKVTLTVTNGSLTLNGTTGLDFTGTCSGAAGDGTADATMTFCGTITNINNAMNGMTYTPNMGYSGPETLTITSDDLGNTGTGGAQTDTDVVNIQVATEIRINDGSSIEPVSPNTIDMVFTVFLNSPAPAGGVTVNFATQDEPVGAGKAVAGTCGSPGADYVATNGTVTFSVGQQVKTINVPICGDAVSEPDETFKVLLFGEVGGTLMDSEAIGTIKAANTAGAVLISELRTSGPGGAGDDFVEIYNNSNSPLTVNASDASAGYGLYKMAAGDCDGTPVLIGVIPNGTVIPARGHYLFVGSAYSLTNYGGTGAAAGNLTLSGDIETDGNVGLFTTSNVTAISSVNRLDAVGFGVNVGGACNLLREADTLPAIAGNATLEHSYFRKMCDWQPGVGCTVPGIPKDTNNNLADFWLADTLGSAATGRLGAPGPENLASPIRRDNANNPGTGGIDVFLLDSTVGSSATPNRKRDGVDPAGTFGSMTLRYRVTNNTGGNVTRLRYRIVDISTAIQPPGPNADLRALTSAIESSVGPVNDPVTCTAGGAGAPPCNVIVQATTLETPPNQAIGGGYNSTLSSGTITLGNPLTTSGTTQSILINFKLGVEKTGSFRFYIIVEALP